MIIERLLTATVLVSGLLSVGRIANAGGLPPGLHLTPEGRYYQDVCDWSLPRHCVAERLLPPHFEIGQTFQPEDMPASGAMTPADVVAAYQIPATASANGKIVATLVTADSRAYADLTVYRQTFGLPSLPFVREAFRAEPRRASPRWMRAGRPSTREMRATRATWRAQTAIRRSSWT